MTCRWPLLGGALVVLAGCAATPGDPPVAIEPMTRCEDRRVSAVSAPSAGVTFAGESYALRWVRQCTDGAVRAYTPDGDRPAAANRLVTVARYPPGGGVRDYLAHYLARTRARRVGEPRVFRREGGGGERRFVVEVMLRPGGDERLEYVLHGLDRRGGRVRSATFAYRFDAGDDAALARLKAAQGEWFDALEGLLQSVQEALLATVVLTASGSASAGSSPDTERTPSR